MALLQSVPSTVSGVLVRRTPTPTHHKFTFTPQAIPTSHLLPGTFSPSLPFITTMLPSNRSLRIYYTSAPTPSTPTSAHLPTNFAPFFFGYWSSNLYQDPLTSSLVFFREDLRPLEVAQCRLLWGFCEVLVRGIYADVLGLWPWGGGLEEVVECMEGLWTERARVDAFYAWAGWYRNGKLLRGQEEWRGVKMVYDEGAGPRPPLVERLRPRRDRKDIRMDI